MTAIMRLLCRHVATPSHQKCLRSVNLRKRILQTFSKMQSTTAQNYYKHGLITLSDKTKMETTLAGLRNFKNVPFTGSRFVNPVSVTFEQLVGGESRQRKWDYIEVHDSIAVLLYDKDKNCVLIVRQFRPTVYARSAREAQKRGQPDPPFDRGFTYELCAGLVDKDKSLTEIVQEEVMEECGYNVPLSAISEVTSYVSAIGAEGTIQTLFYAEVTKDMRNHDGGGLEHDGEAIELLALPFENIDAFIFDTSMPKSTGLMFGFKWLQAQVNIKGNGTKVL